MVSTTMQLPRTAINAPTAEPWVPAKTDKVVKQKGSTLHPKWTVLENVIEPIAATGAPPTLVFQIATEVLDLLDLNQLARTRFDDLSTSQKQRVLIARTMATQPPLGFGEWVQAMERLEGLSASVA